MCLAKLFKPKSLPEPKLIVTSEWSKALGEKENISEVDLKGSSRLSIKVIDPKKVNKELLNSLGVSSIIEMSNKFVLVIENNAELVYQELKK